MLKRTFLITLLVIWVGSVFSSEQSYTINGEKFIYSTPRFSDVFTTMPRNYGTFLKSSFTKETIPAWIAIALSTAILINYDREITDETRQFGRRTGIGNSDGTKAMVSLGSVSVFRGPTDFASAMYFIGDGWTTIGLLGGFYISGKVNDDNRSLQTSAQLLQGLLLTGFTTQILKRATGRESPSVASTPTGKWKPFPSFKQFQNHGVRYNAYPSGHLATVMTTYTIISANYAEYSFIKPVGITLMGLLGFEMINNNVHWASDYPLSIGIGYMLGQAIVKNGRKKIDGTEEKTSYEISPYVNEQGNLGVAWNYFY